MLLTIEPPAAVASTTRDSPAKEISTVTPPTPCISPELLAQQLKEQQPKRWAAFHASEPRIIVYDNNPRTKMRFGIALEQLYGSQVDEAQDHQQLIDWVRDRARSGKPYQLLVIDMHLGEVLGTDVIKELGPDCPVVVFITTSMGLPAFGDLKIKMELFDSENALHLMAQHVQERQQLDIPLAPVFGHLKHAPWEEFSVKVDSGLFLASQRPDHHAAMGDFLQVFVPRRLAINVPVLCAHNLVEDLINALDAIEPRILELKVDHALGEHPWWQKNSQVIDGALEVLRQVRFSNVALGSTPLAWQRVHELVGEFDNLSAEGLNFPKNVAAQRLVRLWQNSFLRYQKEFSVIANELRAYTQGEVSICRTLELAASKYGLELIRIDRQDSERAEPLVHDPEYPLSSFIDQACAAFGVSASPGLRRVSVEFVPESHRAEEPAKVTRTIKQIGAGDYFEVAFIDQSAAPLEDTFANVLRKLPSLRERGQCCFRVDAEEGAPSRLRLFIKASEAHNDPSQYRTDALTAAASTFKVIPLLAQRAEVAVYRIAGSRGEITSLGALPQALDLGLGPRGNSDLCGLVYETAGATFFACADSHKQAARMISEYLGSHASAADMTPQAPGVPSVNEVLRSGVRVSKIARIGLQIEPDAVPEKAERARGALIELGLMPERAEISSKYFQAEKALGGAEAAPSAVWNPAALPEYKRQWFRFEDFTALMRHLPRVDSLQAMAEATIQAYEKIAVGPSINEPSFFIRSTQALNLEQQRQLCSTLLPLMKALDLSAWAISDFMGQVCVEGDAPRKSGLYLFDPQYRGRSDENGACTFAQRLIPLIERSTSIRLGFEGILYIKKGQLLPANSLIYGGGDHSLSGCKQQWGLALAIELSLQAAKIPYDSCRGNSTDQSALVSFNGQAFQAGADLSGMFEQGFRLDV